MISTVKNNRWFFIPYLITAVVTLFFILLFTKASVHLYLNSYYSNFGDLFFKYLTILGDGIIIPFLLIILAFIRFRYAFFILVTYAVSGLFTQILKRTFFMNVERPTKFFEDVAQLHLVPGVEQLSMKSFPSGHTTTAFAIMICFALLVRNNILKLLFFILAALIAYSRVYLSQHFLTDLLAGSLIGTFTGLWLYHVIMPLKWSWLDKNVMSLRMIK
jgi:membrane-associated phospholipid phosphatase